MATTEKQVRTNIDAELHEIMQKSARRLDMTQKAYLKQAIQEKLGRFDADKERQILRKERDKAHEARDHAQVERDHFKGKFEQKCEEVDKLEVCIGNSEARAQRLKIGLTFTIILLISAILLSTGNFIAKYFGIFG